MANDSETQTILDQTSRIVAGYVSKNPIDQDKLPGLIKSVSETLRTCSHNLEKGVDPADDRPEPPVKPSKSIRNNDVLCLECGKSMKMLKRHLKTSHGMTEEQYKQRWNLNVPGRIVCHEYRRRRSKIAHDIGLGQRDTQKAA